MSVIINPNKYKFTTSQDIVITYESDTSLDYGYLYGLEGVVNSKSYNQKTLTFPPFTKEGTYSNCYIGTYVGDKWVQSDYFTIEISNEIPPPIDNPPFVNDISDKNTLVNQSLTISYTATDDKGISRHEFSDNGGNTYTVVNPKKNGDVYSFTKSYSSVGNRTCKIRITDTNNQKSESNNFTIYVTSSNILVESISVNPSSGVINVGEPLQLTATVSPSNATNQNVRWSSLNGDILSVNSNGLVTGISEGSGWIRVMSQDGSSKFKDVRITINPGSSNVPVSGVNISPRTLNLNVGTSGQLNHTITPSNATNQNVTYSSSNNQIATVDNNGLVNAISQGSCATTVTTRDGNKVDTCNITVSNAPSTNTPPNIGNVLVSNENYDGTYTLTYNVTDKENDNISHELKIGSGNYKSINPIKSNNTYKYNGSGLGIGVHTGQIRVSDGKTTAISNQFTIRINEKPASVKVELKLAKDDYNIKHKALKDTINSIILDNKFDKDTEKSLLDNAFNNYNSSLAKYKEVSQKAIDSISQKKADNVKVEIDRDIQDLNNALGDLEGAINGALSDGILSDAEKISIKQHLQTISREKMDIDKQYEIVYINEDLIGVAKENLKTSYNTYNTRYLNLVNTINEVVNKVGVLDSTDQNNLSNAFNEHKNASADYSKRVNEAIDAIAKKKADDAELNAKTHTEAQIKIVNDSIKLKVSQNVYDNNNKVIEDKFSEIKQNVNKVNITVSEIERDYVGISQLEQTVNGWEFKLSQTGRPQLIENGALTEGVRFWYGYQSQTMIELIGNLKYIRMSPRYVSGVQAFGVRMPQMMVIEGKTYTVGCWISGNIDMLNYNYLMQIKNGLPQGIQRIGNVNFGNVVNQARRISITFTAQITGMVEIMLGYEGVMSSDLYFRVAEACCYEGEILYPYKESGNTVYAGNAYIDRTGMGIKHNNGSLSRLTNEEFEFTNTAQQKKMAIKKGSLYAYDVNNGDLLGMFASNKVTSRYRGITTGLTGASHYYAIGATTELTDDDQLNMVPYILIAQEDLNDFLGISRVSAGVNFLNTQCIFHKSPLFKSSPRFEGGLTILDNSGIPKNIYYANNSLYIESNVTLPTGGSFHGGGLYGGDTTSIGYKIGGASVDVIKLHAGIQQIDFLRPLNMNKFAIYNTSLAFASESMPMVLNNKSYAKYNKDKKTVEIDPSKGIVDLTEENENLKKKQEVQEKEIITSMLANVTLYESILEFAPQTLNLRNTSENPMVDVYASLIRKQVKTLKDIPEILKEQVELKLNITPE